LKILYNPELKQRARELRKQGVLAEVLLWNQLKYREMRGYQFMRQKPLENYIVDFYCSKPRTLEPLAKVYYPLTLALSHQGRGLINKPLP
jgi:hypothetical protein